MPLHMLMVIPCISMRPMMVFAARMATGTAMSGRMRGNNGGAILFDDVY